jgi:H+/Cl- antiporter ClcA
MDLGIKKVINDGNGNTLIYTALLAAMVANFTPTIADGIYFSLQQKWKQELQEKKINPEAYWRNNIAGYYGITAGYYGIVLLTMLALKKNDFSTNSKIILLLLGGGFVVSVAKRNIEKDKEIERISNTI